MKCLPKRFPSLLRWSRSLFTSCDGKGCAKGRSFNLIIINFPWCVHESCKTIRSWYWRSLARLAQLSNSSTLSLSLLAELRWIQYLSSKIPAFTKTNDEWKVFPFHHHFHSWNFNFILSTPRLASSRAPFGCFTLRHNANIIPFPCRWQWQPRHDSSRSAVRNG